MNDTDKSREQAYQGRDFKGFPVAKPRGGNQHEHI